MFSFGIFLKIWASEARQAVGKRREEAVGNWGSRLRLVHGATARWTTQLSTDGRGINHRRLRLMGCVFAVLRVLAVDF
jgi:hypothetical protein